MLVTDNFWLLLGAGVALFLGGINMAFLAFLGGRLVGWFKFKIFAIACILAYVALSFSYGNPATSRVIVGWCGLALDMVAVFWMWYSIETTRASGVVGLVPLIVQRGDKGEKGDPGPQGPKGDKGDPGDDYTFRNGPGLGF